jgi:hypothetical protein
VTTATPLNRILILPQNKGTRVGGVTKSDTEKSRHGKTEEDPTLLTMMEKILRFWRRVKSSFQRSKSFTTKINSISLSADAVQVEKITDAHAGATKIAEITTLWKSGAEIAPGMIRMSETVQKASANRAPIEIQSRDIKTT